MSRTARWAAVAAASTALVVGGAGAAWAESATTCQTNGLGIQSCVPSVAPSGAPLVSAADDGSAVYADGWTIGPDPVMTAVHVWAPKAPDPGPVVLSAPSTAVRDAADRLDTVSSTSPRFEDELGWDCARHGNRVCGPGAGPNTTDHNVYYGTGALPFIPGRVTTRADGSQDGPRCMDSVFAELGHAVPLGAVVGECS